VSAVRASALVVDPAGAQGWSTSDVRWPNDDVAAAALAMRRVGTDEIGIGYRKSPRSRR